MISFAQNQEDVVLFRLTQLVPKGTYIDVGAAHPILENVTYALYLEGWRGVNVEPMGREIELLRTERPEDENVQAAVGQSPGTIVLYEAPLENRGATTFDKTTVERYKAAGQSFGEFESQVVTLDSILSQYSSGSVHIVKIDVEGLEKAVLLGANLHQHQPWVLVIEATKPNSQEDSSSEWESIVLEAGYTYTLFDGLNRFYVRNDLADVQKLLIKPANVFDNWKRYQETQSEEYALSLAEVLAARDIEIRNTIEYAESNKEAFERAEQEALRLDEELNEANLYIAALLESIDRIKA
jgi:FkbM family methyltransferase